MTDQRTTFHNLVDFLTTLLLVLMLDFDRFLNNFLLVPLNLDIGRLLSNFSVLLDIDRCLNNCLLVILPLLDFDWLVLLLLLLIDFDSFLNTFLLVLLILKELTLTQFWTTFYKYYYCNLTNTLNNFYY